MTEPAPPPDIGDVHNVEDHSNADPNVSGTSAAPSTQDTPSDNEKVTIACPQSITMIHDPDGRFPDVTPAGAEMTKDQAQIAKQVAATSFIQLITVGGRN